MAAPEDDPPPDIRLITATHYNLQEEGTRGQEEGGGEAGARGREGGGCWGARHTVALLGAFGIFLDFMIQTILAVAIVAMVGERSAGEEDKGDVCPLPGGQNSTEETKPGEFDWDERTQGIIQGSILYGCSIISLPGGRLAEVYGGTRVFGLMVACACLLCFISPIAAYTSTWLFIAVRVMQGIAVGGMFPTMNTILMNWFPLAERSKFTSIILTGMNLGSVTSMSLTGWLCELGWLGGWPAPFYVVGAAGMVWTVLWFLLVHPTPEEHPRITQKELYYILGGARRVKQKKKWVPWGPFLRSPAVWVLTMTSMGDTFSQYIIMTMLPTYLANIQHFKLSNAGVLAALPHLLSCAVSVGWGCVVGCLTAAQILTTRRIRQLSTCVALYVPAACMLGMCLVRCDKNAAIALLIVSVCANTCIFTGYISSFQDLSPTYCGTAMGFTAIFSSLSAMAGPLVTGVMINNRQTLGAWRNVFFTSALAYIVCCTIYIIFTPVRQHWDSPSSLTSSSSFPPRGFAKAVQGEGVRV